ncbi:hypothetical protein K6U06_04320 [Acidiferrimicrobium sp. IK]|uniref:hypothetical protein n=1 Tax=Acidiferrimicrobium sp. IK TaxID=2871700 RepID=UPI0021CB8E42|nr:hypothetical protein [Acidiferrimicrobium sp. IK]MCU4183573.1 hypothetical protein [Acidiferrimicrobium sp. IK]
MPIRDETPPDRDAEGNEDRPGRSGPDVGDAAGGQGAEFAGDAAAAGRDVTEEDAAGRLAAGGS